MRYLLIALIISISTAGGCERKNATPAPNAPAPASAPAAPSPEVVPGVPGAATQPAANQSTIDAADRLLRTATTYTYQKKFDLAEATLQKLETVMDSLPASMQEEIKAARVRLAEARASTMGPAPAPR